MHDQPSIKERGRNFFLESAEEGGKVKTRFFGKNNLALSAFSRRNNR